jgi:hypothetical protein
MSEVADVRRPCPEVKDGQYTQRNITGQNTVVGEHDLGLVCPHA